MTGPAVRSYEMHRMGVATYWFLCILAIFFGAAAILISIHATEGKWPIRILGFLFVICGLSMTARPRTLFESTNQTVKRELRLFGKKTLLSRTYPYSAFDAVVLKHVQRSNSGRDPDEYYVSLHHQCGSKILIGYFEADISGNCAPAEHLAKQLSADMGIIIDRKCYCEKRASV